MIELKNKDVIVKINPIGAELKSMVCYNTRYIWEGNEENWKLSAPLMFPICGGLKDDKYIYCGKEYSLEKHGYIRFKTFEVEKISETSVTLLHKSDEQTKMSYPFDYELRVVYSLIDKTLKIDYLVKNVSDDAMYFSIGSHEGYYTPEGIEDYDVIFPQSETLTANVLYGNLLSNQEIPIIKDSAILPLYNKYFLIDALVFSNIKSRKATLRNRKTGKAICVEFPDDNYFLIWQKPNAPFICLEPWSGIADRVGSSFDITKKEGIMTLGSNCEYTHTHSITILE